jgi:hypothetical protein
VITTLELVLAWAQFALLCPLAILGLHRGWMVFLYLRHRRAAFAPLCTEQPAELPAVTIQLPIYNERSVAERLVRAAAALDYPAAKLQIQVLDDSTDDTTDVVRDTIARLPRTLRVEHVRRPDRHGYKAGALAHGLQTATGTLIGVFDADFVPPREFLRETVSAFSDPGVGMVQARWEHLNPDYNLLTGMQALLLDGHFVVEHVARSQSGCYFNFNGTAGLFRRACIEDAGGWQHDTLTEDMDLSYRAQLRGWRFLYRPALACPAELPVDMNAFLNQQHRWAKGSVQTGRKLLGRILRAPIPWLARVEAVFHLLGNFAFVLMLLLILVALPLQIVQLASGAPVDPWLRFVESLPLFVSTLCVLLYYGVSQAGLDRLRAADLLRIPLLIALGAGMCINNTAAVFSAFGSSPGEFLRTPKHNIVRGDRQVAWSGYRSRRGWLPFVEVALGLYAATTASIACGIDKPWTAVFHGMFALGLLWTGASCIVADWQRRERSPLPEPAVQA